MQNKIRKFTDLIAWQKGHEIALMVYKITNNFPDVEKFGLISQIRRCAVSITSNIAEGFSRRTLNDKNHFFFMALGSVTELQNQTLLSRDLKYLNKDEFQAITDKTVEVHKLINGLIKSNNNKIEGKK